MMCVVGTAGHVDHGKSTLVNALTGINPDRLKEEQAREMTIDLGFAWLTLPDGNEVGIVDVPGHRDFIENMLAGVGGIDAALFVVAADEGVMPQTREHLAILDLLQIHGGIIVLTKIDLVDDPEWLAMVETDVRQALAGTVLADAPLVRVSARRGDGLDMLKTELAHLLAESPTRPDLGRPRLSVDRVFSISGFGTVVTGTLLDGSISTGDEVELLPDGLRSRVRGLQSHKQKVSVATPGSRTAVNITGIDLQQVSRGDVLAAPGKYAPTRRLDVHVRLLPDMVNPITHNMDVKLFIGAAEVQARLRLLGVDELSGGQEGWLQLEPVQPVVAVRGDRFILRRPSPGETLGGGRVVDPHPAGRHRRFAADIIRQLESLDQGTPGEILLQSAAALGIASLGDVTARARLSGDQLVAALVELSENGQLISLEDIPLQTNSDTLVVSQPQWQDFTRRCLAEMGTFHRQFPLRRGMSREELKSRLKLSTRVFNAAVRRWSADGTLAENGAWVALAGHKVSFSSIQQSAIDRLWGEFARSPWSPPSIKDCQAVLGDEVYNTLVEQGELQPVSVDVVFRPKEYAALLEWVRRMLAAGDTLTVAQFRDHFNTSRKYALAFLEHLDAVGVTERDGDTRKLKT